MFIEELERYAEDHTTPELPVLAKLNRETHLTQMYPRMLAGHLQGAFLSMISHMIKPERILEIGTFTGYSTICLAAGLADPSPKREGRNGVIHTIEVDPELEGMARRYFHEAGMEDLVILHIGNAMEIIPALKEQWDLVYIDADKPNYLNYYKMVFDNVRPGGYIIADNVLWGGKVLESKPRSKETLGIIEFNEFVHRDERVENVVFPVRDGIMVVRKF
jgi:caffeoyl-CoA O-methyltransferase